MPAIHYEGQDFSVQPGETVLDCLLRNGVAISYSCKAGSCQSCLVEGSHGPVPEFAQRGLKDTLRAQGYFLACSCRPEADLTVTPAGNRQRTPARISHLELLNHTILRVRLRAEAPFGYFAGQFVSVFREDGVARSYSLASLPCENELEMHVRKIPGGAMSEWLHHEARIGARLWLQGPAGNCFYVPGSAGQPLLLTGAGTGLAPLYGILREAMRQGHAGPVWLFQGALTPGGLYLTRELGELQRTWPNFHYVRAVLRGGDSAGEAAGADVGCVDVGALDDCILGRFPSLAGWKGYIRGDPPLVNSLRKKLFLAGMASNAIYSDAFLPSVI
jgi:NAD(P)H-flavin reductase/ferredoxin